MYRFDYTSQDCQLFHDAVRQHITPLKEILARRRRDQLGVSELRPWDMQVDPDGAGALKPFSDEDSLLTPSAVVFGAVAPDIEALFSTMRREGRLDLFSRSFKSQGGYCMTFPESRRQFIFMNLSGTESDLTGLFHEMGHAYHGFLCAQEPLIAYRKPPIEFAEVASFEMEFLCAKH